MAINKTALRIIFAFFVILHKTYPFLINTNYRNLNLSNSAIFAHTITDTMFISLQQGSFFDWLPCPTFIMSELSTTQGSPFLENKALHDGHRFISEEMGSTQRIVTLSLIMTAADCQSERTHLSHSESVKHVPLPFPQLVQVSYFGFKETNLFYVQIHSDLIWQLKLISLIN